MTGTTPDFTDDARLAVFQARHEALALGAPRLLAAHLALGVLRTLSRFQRAACFAGPHEYDRLCHALGAGPGPAPLIPEDIEYSVEARAAMAGAIRLARDDGPGAPVAPCHLLLGILDPGDPASDPPLPPSGAAIALLTAGLDPPHVRLHLGWPR